MCRILKKNGVLFIGFPNRNRLLGYMGSCNNITLMQKIKWNLNDYLQRIKGRFKNEFGAHAGFTEKEFIPSANIFFSEVIPVRNDYYHKKYSRHNKLIQLMIKTGLSEYLFPSNYFICKK